VCCRLILAKSRGTINVGAVYIAIVFYQWGEYPPRRNQQIRYFHEDIMDDWTSQLEDFQQFDDPDSEDLDKVSSIISSITPLEYAQLERRFDGLQMLPSENTIESLTLPFNNIAFQLDNSEGTGSKNGNSYDISAIECSYLALLPDLYDDMNNWSSQALPAIDNHNPYASNYNNLNPSSTESLLSSNLVEYIDQNICGSMLSINKTDKTSSSPTFEPQAFRRTGLNSIIELNLPLETLATRPLEHLTELPDYYTSTADIDVTVESHVSQVHDDLRPLFVNGSGGFRRTDDSLIFPVPQKR
jgi:hypothetical protein